MPKRILVLDDEVHILELVKYNLEKNGYEVLTAEIGEDALKIVKDIDIDLAILDLMLPTIDGLEVLKQIRQSHQKDLPVILLTAKTDEFDKVIGLELGADDYVSKPFGIHELLARVKALLRRTRNVSMEEKTKQLEASNDLEKDEIIEIEDLSINKTRHTVKRKDEFIEMPLKEFNLLYYLAKNPGHVFTREALLRKIWGYEYEGETRTVDVHIRNIRKKLEPESEKSTYIKTIRGLGYKFYLKGEL